MCRAKASAVESLGACVPRNDKKGCVPRDDKKGCVPRDDKKGCVPRDDTDGLSPRAIFIAPRRKGRGLPGDAVPNEVRDASL